MAERQKHLFHFSATKIASAAMKQAQHHEKRLSFWYDEYEKAVQRVKATCSCEVREEPVSGGTQARVVVNYGDVGAYARMNEAHGKIQQHRAKLEAYRSDAEVYATQGDRSYEMGIDDVQYYHLDGRKSEE